LLKKKRGKTFVGYFFSLNFFHLKEEKEKKKKKFSFFLFFNNKQQGQEQWKKN
jgi:hypothetical protein